ncbi:hypothetical protein T8833_08080 [Staphylococcus aureus]|nr:hypothetical protein T8833_08080 [Staphylococcus aureus]
MNAQRTNCIKGNWQWFK